jgi:hypothetical protein
VLRTLADRPPRRAVAAVATGLVLVGAVGLVAHVRNRATGAPPASDVGVVSASTQLNPAPTPSTGPTPGAGLLGTHSTELGSHGANGAAPASLAIPRLRVRVATAPAGLAGDGRSLQLRPSARAVDWWAYGGSPGASSGTVLLAGHVSWDGRVGVLAGLRRLRLGDPITVRRQDGRLVHYVVTGRRQVPKTSLADLGLFARTGAPRLVLVTCGGAFDPRRHSYDDNVVVQARPL